MIHPGFLKHGMFIEGRPISTLLRYRNYKAQPSILSRLVTMLPDAIRPALDPALLIEQFIRAMNNMAVRSIWLQLFNADGELDRDGKVAALKSVGIVPVGGAGTAALGGFSTRHMTSLSTPLFSSTLLSVWLLRPVLAQHALKRPLLAAMGSRSMSSGL